MGKSISLELAVIEVKKRFGDGILPVGNKYLVRTVKSYSVASVKVRKLERIGTRKTRS